MAIGIIIPFFKTAAIPIALMFLYFGLSMMLKKHSEKSIVFRCLPIVICVITFLILQKYLPQPQIDQTQWYLKISGNDFVPTEDKDGNPIGTPFRIIPIINERRYSYPTDSVLTTYSVKRGESFPIPIDIKPPYRIKFEGILVRGEADPIPMKSAIEDIYQTSQLPIRDCTYEIAVNDSLATYSDVTKIIIHYEIISYQEKNK